MQTLVESFAIYMDKFAEEQRIMLENDLYERSSE